MEKETYKHPIDLTENQLHKIIKGLELYADDAKAKIQRDPGLAEHHAQDFIDSSKLAEKLQETKRNFWRYNKNRS